MRRRTFLSAFVAATAGSSVASRITPDVRAASGEISGLNCYSTSSLVNHNGNELTDSSVVAVWVEDTAANNDGDGNGDATNYGSSTPIPVVASDWNVVGFGSTMVEDGTSWQYGNEEFVLNVWDAELGGSGTVLWDEGHGQYYTLSKFSEFESYAEDNGYTVTATSSLASDLSGADAAVVTSPSTAFTQSELSDLGDFVANGGTLFLHSQSDYSGYDETANLNDLAGYLELAFRFNDDEVLDASNNAGADYQPVTDEFNTGFDYFGAREGLGLKKDETYTVDVTSVTDGDTVDVTFSDGSTESIRILGIDTPEKSSNSSYERPEEWEGIESMDYLTGWGADATTFAKNELSGKTVDLSFDDNEPVRDAYGRVLGYIHYDRTGDGSRDTLYNRYAVQEGYARVYGSSFARHESFWDAENAARANGTNVWGASDPANSSEIRNRAVDDLFFPTTASVRTASGTVADSRVPVYAESTANQSGGVSYSDDVPLAAVDEANRVAVVGSPLVDEAYEKAEGFAVDTSGYENFVFTTNLVDYLTDLSGDLLIDGGHGQFGADYALSNEDAAYYQRYLEGVDIGFEQVNAITTDNLSRGRGILVTTPVSAFTQSETDALNSFVADGGAVILVGAGTAPDSARSNLNDLATGLGTDLRLNGDQITDSSNNVNGDGSIPTTTNFDTSFPLFDAYGGSGGGGGGSGELSIAQIHEDASGDDTNNLNDEYVVFENIGGSDLNLTGWSVQDEVGKTYDFPSGFALAADAQVTLRSGQGTDTQTDLYWGRTGSAVWNNGGDTVSVYDDSSSLHTSKSY